jgi:hypothetical protein
MKLMRKLLGLGLLASLAAVAFVVVTASANQEGHFVTTGSQKAEVLGTEKGHTLEWTVDGIGGVGIICNDAKWDALTDNETEQELVFDPSFKECRTTGQPPSFEIKRNSCLFVFYVAKGTTSATEQTAKLDCGSGKLEILHPSCTITVPGQSIPTGITYTKTTFGGKSVITADFNVKLNMETDGPFCAKGQKTGKLEGSILFEAFDAQTHAQVDLTAT